ncbi:MAG: carbon-nitrogen hydrolase family protein [Planctomycetota bacterium]|jgi:predicted amidohydrolase
MNYRKAGTAILLLILLCSLITTAATKPSTEKSRIDSGSKSKTLTVAVISSHSVFGDPGVNIKHFERLIREASGKGARLACFPELALTAYSVSKEIVKYAEEIPGPSTRKLADIARTLQVYLSVGMAEKAGDKYYIAQVLVGPEGYLGKYRKHHPTGPEKRCGFLPGREFPVWDVEGFKLGINICADGRQEDTIEAMKEAKVDVIHHPHGNWLGLGKEAEEWTRGKMVYFVPRATFSRAYILINNSAGDTKIAGKVRHFGSGALAIDPLGQVVDRTTQQDRREKLIIVTLKKPLSDLIPAYEMARLGR